MPGQAAESAGKDGVPLSTKPKAQQDPAAAPGLSEELAAQLAGLPDESARQQFLEHHQELQRANVVGWLTDVVRRYIRMDTKQALAIAEFNVSLARTLRDQDALANALLWLGNALYNTGRHKEALDENAQALGLFRQLGKRSDVARTLNASIQPMLLLGRYEEATRAAEEASAIFRAEGNLWRLARVELNSGNIYYRQDRFSEALAHYRAAYEALLPYHEQDAEAIAVVLHNIAVCSISLNQFREAHSTYEAARKFAAEHQMPTLVAQADYNIAWLFYLRGDYSRAIGMLRSTREACRANGDVYHFALCHMDLAEIYLELNLSEEAAENAREGAALFEKLGHGYETAKCYANLAIALGQQHQMFAAIEMFTKARAIMVREQNQVWPSVIDLYQALLLFDEGRYFEARRLCIAALEFFRKSSVPGKAVLCEVLLARLHLRAGEAARALEFAASAVERACGLESPLLAYEAHLVSGEIHIAAGNPAKAYASIGEARLALETLRSNLHRDELKISFVKNRLQVYEALVALCLARGTSSEVLQEAFGYIEEAKSRSLLHLTGRGSIARHAVADAQSELVRKIGDLREELNFYYHRIEQEQLRPEERSPERIQELQDLARKREEELLRMWREAPDPAQLSPDHLPAFSGLQAVQSALPADSALIEYFYLQERIVAAVVTAEGLAIHGVTIAPRVNSLIKLLQFQLAKMARGTAFPTLNPNASMDATREHLRALYQELLAPVIGSIRASRLVLVPHGVLHHVPFHALFDGEHYLIDRFGVSYAPSASVFAVAARRLGGSARGALVLGVADQAAPSIADEVEAIGRLLPEARVFSGAEASRGVLEQQGASSRFIHIATHGFFRQDNPMFSGIRLGDAVLSLYDLYHLNLPAELVTLSGCATGMSVVAAGDELLGLVRGLLGAGACSVLLTLWDVHDRSTAEFMKSFYANLLRGADKDRALQQAMIELRNIYPHPYHWAPFSLVGKTSGIAPK